MLLRRIMPCLYAETRCCFLFAEKNGKNAAVECQNSAQTTDYAYGAYARQAVAARVSSGAQVRPRGSCSAPQVHAFFFASRFATEETLGLIDFAATKRR